MKLKQYISLLLVLLSAGMTSSCTDWLDEQPKDKQSELQQFATKEGFQAAVNGIYNRMSGSSLYGSTLSYSMIDLLGQRYTVEQASEESYYKYLRALTEWNYSDETVIATLGSTWGEAYQTIMNINVILENLEKDAAEQHTLPQTEYKMLKGEMLAARAMLHFDMLRLFGPIYSKHPEERGVPYNQSTKTEILPILTAEDVLSNYILRDLTEAEKLLLDSDPVITEGPRAVYDEITMDNSMRYRQLRLNYYATVLLTARAYLWKGDYTNALTEAKKLTDDPKVRTFFPKVNPGTLLGNSSDPDRMFSTESLFGFYNADRKLIYNYTFGGEDTGKRLLIPRPNYVKALLFNGETQDYRCQSQWDNGTTLDGTPSDRFTKFKEITDNQQKDDTEDIDGTAALRKQKFYATFCSLIKLSEAYYIAAEAMGNSTSPEYNLTAAWNYLNTIRADRGIPAKSGNESQLTDLITKEYIREFIGEGQIFFYFKRLNKGFDNDYNGRQEMKVMTAPEVEIFPGWVIPAEYSYKDDATDEEKEKRFVLPLPKNELDNR
ncbi:RagB/SusD family nutrient uptake outer membrane protein [Bacteroides sp. AN502(2024)]|uniref:RagB/SusD family nutrient uptake outer membrane protein n=1 Tax=Bacteroides sp. AN502(2024) TaxID=3160599 RepID=UPI003512BBB7